MNVGSITHIHMLALTIDDVDNIERTNQFQKKILKTVFINGNSLILLDIMPQNVKITLEYFVHNVIKKLNNVNFCWKQRERKGSL